MRGRRARGKQGANRRRPPPTLTPHPPSPPNSRPSARTPLTVTAALSRAGKEATVAKLVDAFDSSAVAFGVRFKGVSVKDVEGLRRSLPPTARMIVCKNTLIKRAAEKAAGEWEVLSPAAALDNAWIFADEEAISGSVKAYTAFAAKLQETLTKEERATVKLTTVSGGVLEGRFLTGADVESLKNMPTKAELMQKIAILIKRVPTKLALSIKAVPRKVAFGVKALADGDDDTTKVVGDVFPKAT